MDKVLIAEREYPLGSYRFCRRRYKVRVVRAPGRASTNDLRSKGVKVLWESGELVEWWKGASGRRRNAAAERFLAEYVCANGDVQEAG